MKSRQQQRATVTSGFNALEGLARVSQSLHQVIHDFPYRAHCSSQTRFVICRVQLAAWLVLPSALPFFFVFAAEAILAKIESKRKLT